MKPMPGTPPSLARAGALLLTAALTATAVTVAPRANADSVGNYQLVASWEVYGGCKTVLPRLFKELKSIQSMVFIGTSI